MQQGLREIMLLRFITGICFSEMNFRPDKLNIMSISQRQKKPVNLELIKAFVVQYNEAKKIQVPRIVITYLLAVAAPFIVLSIPSTKNLFSIVGATWSVIALICSYLEKDSIKVAAKIQDQFDVAVFQLDWNKILLGDPVSDETIHNLSAKYNGKIDTTWYGNLDAASWPFDVVLCQRTSVVWDWRLRMNWFRLILVLLVILFISGILLSLQNNLLLGDYLKIIFLPSSSAYILGYKELSEHYENIRAKENLEKKLNSVLESAITKVEIPNEKMLRQIQDVIYILRKCNAIVPTWFSKLYRNSYEKRMQLIINKYSAQLRS
jgi:hypothetical protein